MKTLILLFISISCYSQNTTIHFYYGAKNIVGSEIMFHIKNTESTYFGGAFSGALKQEPTMPGKITAYFSDQTVTKSFNEEWCSIYGVGSSGLFKSILIKYKGGLSVYNRKVEFNNEYYKIDKIVYKPLIGIGAMYAVTDDIGVEAGIDTFNKGTIGLTVNF
ncbi:hypothetical protein [Flavobacterium granuli]|uniref:Outer membrane protein beta-barrel domain-containing protein n=1 Tax=Flavobacterium granuli TaxID=280093 RepID=A0ABU1S210_9FLAO|nr:hypothetical protein [Flavobacterium granuli]MDR6845053.1 hypothetical protein [Flavobacterium granuli]